MLKMIDILTLVKKLMIKIHPKFKIGNHVRISRYQIIFAKGYTNLYVKWRGYDNSLIVGLTKNTECK